jgi:5-methylcytosine-specific restriction enzyme B
MKRLIDIIHSPGTENWLERSKPAFYELFGGGARYPEKARRTVTLRAPEFKGDTGVSFASLIHPSNPDSGQFGGMCFVIFPISDGPCLVALGIGTQGLSPDEEILGRPGHARKVAAICSWLNREHGKGEVVAWAKQDPVRVDLDMPDIVKKQFSKYDSVFSRYGKVLYGIFIPNEKSAATSDAVAAFLDLMFEERGQFPLKAFEEHAEKIRSKYFSFLMPDIEEDEVYELLNNRRFVILEGPPGTGKTRMALRMLKNLYENNGFSIQFHPNTTYENFVGGLAPVQTAEGMGFRFAPQKGFLMKAAEEAAIDLSRPYLLHIDEINRADLSKVLGEAIFLFESEENEKRELKLPYNFGEPFGNNLRLPSNLHILGTMNSADRSIAIVDVAVRRRFAFVKLWPQMAVVQSLACEKMHEAFKKAISIFIEHAGEDAFTLVPGHSYFLESEDSKVPQHLKVNLAPLLEEYLAQGYVASFSEPIRAYLQWIEGLQP